MTTNTKTIGERIADDFCENKRYLTDAEKRRLAGMIDAAMLAAPDLLAACKEAKGFIENGNVHGAQDGDETRPSLSDMLDAAIAKAAGEAVQS